MATACHSGETNRRLDLQPMMCIHDSCIYISIYILHRSKYDICLKYDKPHPKLVVLFCCGFSGKMGNRDSKLDGQVTDHCSRGELHKHICVATRKSCAL